MHTWVVLLLLLTLATISMSEHYHIVPVDSTSCHDYQNGTCFTLEQLVQTDLLSGGDNLTLSFLSGDHTLSEMLHICNFREVIIAGQSATINFNKTGSLQISNISKLSVESLHFNGTSNESSLGYIYISQCYLVDLNLLKLEACTTLWITRTVTVTIEQVLFVNNTSTDRALIVEADNLYIEKNSCFSNGGGAVNINSIINDSSFNSNTGVLSVFSANVYIEKSNFFSNDGGMAVFIYSNQAVINDSRFHSNTGAYGALPTYMTVVGFLSGVSS